ncbi:MAG: aminopeptidase [Clostridiales bacterium]|nr:aminopeptidase [Clostridiales bacterium]
MDERTIKLAQNIVNYSIKVKKGERVLISSNGLTCLPLVKAVIKEVYKAGAVPYADLTDSSVTRELVLNSTEQQWKFLAEVDMKKMEGMDAYVGIGGNANTAEMADVPAEKMDLYSRFYQRPVTDVRLKKKWVVLRYPNNSLAQSMGTSLESFEDFFYKVCNLDYSKMSKAMDSLVDLMNKTDKVRLVAPNTDLTFSIKGIPAIKCAGEMNIPDGEVYTAPVKDSVNGRITYNTPSPNRGFTFENVSLVFKDGKIVEATANDNEKVNAIFSTDEGAKYVGEFAIGVNPYITKPMKNILFDEKIRGSIHFTPGNAYDDADNGNRSALHWDLVLIMTKECGGGEIYFDDRLIRKDGVFVVPELLCLNPENLV